MESQNEQRLLFEAPQARNEYADITANKHKANPQSVAANIVAAKGKPTLRKQIFEFIGAHPNCIAEEVLTAFPSKRYSSVTARISELRASGEVCVTGTKKTKYSGSEAATLKVNHG